MSRLDAKLVIEDIIGRKIDWFDYKKLDQGARSNYKNDADFIRQNETFNNEISHYITDLMKFMAYEATNFEQILHTRTSIVTLETFRQRLENIEDPKSNKSNENLNETI